MGVPDDETDGFLHIVFHGAHDGGLGKDQGISAMVELTRNEEDLYGQHQEKSDGQHPAV